MTQDQAASMSRLKCSDIMTKNVQTASPEMSIADVAKLMREGDMGAVPVVDNGRLVGVVTDRDIVVRALADGRDASSAVADSMTTEIFSVKPDAFVFEAVRLMGDKQVRRVPVLTNDGQLAGIIAMADIALEMEDEREIAETLEEISSGSSFWKKK